jgi:hypothetical protein
MTIRPRRAATAAAALLLVTLVSPAPAGASTQIQVVDYDASSLAEYHQMWNNMYGPLDNAAESFTNGTFTAADSPFKSGTDYSVYDHLKYFAVSDQSFPAPSDGSVTISANLNADTPGATARHVVHGQYGPPGSFVATNRSATPYTASTLEGQQAAVVLNMIDFCTGQLFDWFLSSHYAFPLIERLPTAVTGNTTNPDCPDAADVGLTKMYTQIVKNIPITAGVTHRVAITYRQAAASSSVTYLLDGAAVATVSNVGIPLDKQRVPYSGTYPSLGNGEPLAGKIHSFVIGHGLFSLLDAFPFQFGCTPPTASAPGTCDPADARYSVSIPSSERAFGQGAIGSFNHFTVATVTR